MTTPLFASPLLSFALSAFSLDRDNSAFASHRERSQGARAKVSVRLLNPPNNVPTLKNRLYVHGENMILHMNTYIGISITCPLTPLSRTSSSRSDEKMLIGRVRELARPSTKSSLIHTWTSDTRDDPWMGTSGRLLKATYVSSRSYFEHMS
jgi:outer membrane protein insertion porin family